jgi:S1-C subfamily serine protease
VSSTPTLDQPPGSAPNGHRTIVPAHPLGREERPLAAGLTRRALALTVVCAALLGGGLAVGLLYALGGIHAAAPTTSVVEQPVAGSGGSSSRSPLNAGAVYASAAAGVVDITSRGVSSGGGQGPFAPPGPAQATASGTGSVIDARGHILTAAHVVDGSASITVTFQNGTTRPARVLGEDLSTDVAVLQVDPSGLRLEPLALGSSRALSVGDALAVIGDPYQFDRSLSTGVVSGLDRTIQAPNGFTVAHAIQTDAALNPGNSGGPVLDTHGRVVGIADQIATGGSGAQGSTGVGFAVPVDIVRAELSRLEQGAQVAHAYLGVSTTQATNQPGALIQAVRAATPAAAAGLRSGDVIVRLDGSAVRGSSDVVAAISSHRPGDRVTLTVQRGSSRRTLSATLAAQPRQASTG